MAPRSAVQRLHEEFGGITASKAATIAGVNPWQSPYALFLEMSGQSPAREQTFPMWLGSQMEGIVIRAFTRETGLKCRRPHRAVDPDFWFTTEEFGFPMGCLIDAWTLDPGKTGVEAKTASGFMASEWEDDVPLHYFIQIQHQLAVTGWDHFYAAAIVGNKYVQHTVWRDDELIALLTDRERDFYQHLVAGIPPDVDGHESTSAAINARYPRSTPDAVEVIDDPELERLAMAYTAQGRLITEQKAAREETANRLKVVLEDREAVISGSHKILWKTQARTTFDLTRFRDEHPELAAEYEVKGETRPLKVTETKRS